ncbi:bb6a2646-986b-4324-9021-8929c8eb78e1-CDS [Sclerotinia trifoliorum]|uniref:Bb6a2646-986b-4324-9021-8929c8eb78e1-CDS n=1 Tax=Sclerotinia trifoliorum TaxID=28548 RepID=A0A8H2VW80_9HELO|nr:bb6a2646-986b-4324-9021-8929c8eb78e1-CDS [Sclerotinia trifoliorum]
MMRFNQRCIDIEPPDVMHPRIRDACIDMSREWDQIWGGDEWEGDEEDNWEEEFEEDEVYDEEMEDGEEDEYEDYDELGEYMDEDEDEDGHGGGNFEGIVNVIGGGDGNWNYTYRSWCL